MALLRALQKPTRILCARELQNSIKDSVHKLLIDQIDLLNLPGFSYGESFIRHTNGSEFVFKGIRSNVSEIKSMEGIDLCWVEEAQKVSEDSWQVLIPTIRAPQSEIWVTFNPGEKADPTSKRFIENRPPSSKIAKVNYTDNPWFSDELREEMEWLKSIDPKMYAHVWEGEYADGLRGGKVCKTWSFANIQDTDYKAQLAIYLTCDFNVDPMCWALAHRFNGEYHFFDEICLPSTTTIEATDEFIRRYPEHKAGIIITGDASGQNRSTVSQTLSQTNYAIIRSRLSETGYRDVKLDLRASNPLFWIE